MKDSTYLQVLGPLAVIGAPGASPNHYAPDATGTQRQVSGHEWQVTLTVAYLALVPGRARTAAALAEQVAPGGIRLAPATVTARLSRARSWLGEDPATGLPYVPRRGAGETYRTTLPTDWHRFTALVGSDPDAAPLSRLDEALSLVVDRPLCNVGMDAPWAEQIREDMTAAIARCAHALAVKALAVGRVAQAARAVKVGRWIDAADPQLMLDALAVALATHHQERAADLAQEVLAWSHETGIALGHRAEVLVHRAPCRSRALGVGGPVAGNGATLPAPIPA